MFEVLLNHQALETLGTTNVIVDEICGEGTWAGYVARCQRWEDSQAKKETLIFYESPHRLIDTLDYLRQTLGNRSIAVCRELTKLHEDIYRGTIEEAYNWFLDNRPRGEFVLVISGKSEGEFRAEKEQALSGITVEQHLINLINSGIDKKEAIKMVAKEREIPKKEVYKIAINL